MRVISTCLVSSFLVVACGQSEPKAPAPTPKPIQETSPKTEIVDEAPIELSPVQRGKKVYARCRSCHTLEEGGRHMAGPNLWDVYGSKAASKEGFAYSKAMKAVDLVWDDETMDGYLKKPSAFMPGNKMAFIGLKKQEDRDAVQAYMKSKTTP